MNSFNKNPLTHRTPRTLLVQLAVIGILALGPTLKAQTNYDFNAGNDSGWSRYNLGAIFGVGAATFSFPLDPTNGHAYRIQAAGTYPYDTQPFPPIGQPLGPGRAASFRGDSGITGRFSIGVDILSWNASLDQYFGPLWYITTPGPGTTSGYGMVYGNVDAELDVDRIDGETPTTMGRVRNFYLDPTASYRFVVTFDGLTFLSQIFNLQDLKNPVESAISYDTTYTAGAHGLLVYDNSSASTAGADTTFDNVSLAAPAANSLPATAVHLYPRPFEKNKYLYPTNYVAILHRDTTVNVGSLLLYLDGALIPSSSISLTGSLVEDNPTPPSIFDGTTMTYPIPTLYPYGTLHTNTVVFQDNLNHWFTNTWTWTTAYTMLWASNSVPLGSYPVRGWDVRMVWTNGAAVLGDSLARAEKQLAVPPQIPFVATTQTVLQVLNFNDVTNNFGYFTNPAPVPGLTQDGSHDNIACEMFCYLELTAGPHRFGVVSDDGFQLRSGSGLRDTNASVLGVRDGGTFNGTFDFVAEANALYPARCIWYENGGSADFQMFSADLNNATARVLVGDPTDPAGVVKVYLPLRLLASSGLDGPWTLPTGAVLDPIAKTATVPMSGDVQYYRIQSLNPVTLTGISRSGDNILISYQ